MIEAPHARNPKNAGKATKRNLISLQCPISDMLSSPNLLEKGNDDDSPDVDSGKDNNSTEIIPSSFQSHGWRMDDG